ncbi:MAG: helix-turn-helix transcriptional regulator [Bacteroidota bacterium]
MDIANNDYKQSYLSSNIRWLRKQKKWSQEELASKVDLNRGNIASYENGTAEPKICNLLKMAKLFSINLICLVQRDLGTSEEVFPPASVPLAGATPVIHNMDAYLDRAKELQKVMDGLNICCRYKVKMMDGNLPKEMQLVALHFEELYDTAQTLLEQHLALLEDVSEPETPQTQKI